MEPHVPKQGARSPEKKKQRKTKEPPKSEKMREVDSLTPGRNNRTKPSVTFCAIIQKFNGLHSSEAKSKV